MYDDFNQLRDHFVEQLRKMGREPLEKRLQDLRRDLASVEGRDARKRPEANVRFHSQALREVEARAGSDAGDATAIPLEVRLATGRHVRNWVPPFRVDAPAGEVHMLGDLPRDDAPTWKEAVSHQREALLKAQRELEEFDQEVYGLIDKIDLLEEILEWDKHRPHIPIEIDAGEHVEDISSSAGLPFRDVAPRFRGFRANAKWLPYYPLIVNKYFWHTEKGVTGFDALAVEIGKDLKEAFREGLSKGTGKARELRDPDTFAGHHLSRIFRRYEEGDLPGLRDEERAGAVGL